MPLPVKIIFTPANGACGRCQLVASGLDISLFTRTQSATLLHLCLKCLSSNEEIVGDMALIELMEKRSRRKLLRKQRTVSVKQEIEIAEALGARIQKASGALAGSKGDGRRKGVLRFEAKYTMNDSYPLRLDDLDKIASECHGAERPLLVLDFKDKATGRLRDRFVVLRFDHAKEMIDVGHDR